MKIELSRDLALAASMTWRKILEQYRGAVLGPLWALITPLAMLTVFTFVFGVVFQSRWHEGTTNIVEFAIILFCGMTTYAIFANCLSAAPNMVSGQRNLVKKIVFPLHMLPLVLLGDALFDAAISYALLIVFETAFGGGLHPTMLLLPVLIVPLCLFVLGLVWFVGALGVYVSDIRQLVQPVVTALMFLSAVFYPLSAMPGWIRPILEMTPLAGTIEMVRNAMVFNTAPDLLTFCVLLATGILVALSGFAFFQATRKGFADVL
jgi:lipopolysaccharide transport system permease protein